MANNKNKQNNNDKKTRATRSAGAAPTQKAQAGPRLVKGSGDYRLLGRVAAAGARAGAFSKAGGVLDTVISGFGDYSLSSTSTDPPKFVNVRPRRSGVVINETSFMVNVVATGAAGFALQAHATSALDPDGLSYALSPSNESLHIRGAYVAKIFEEAAYLGMVLTYIPALSELNANGSIIVSVEYDPSRANYASEAEMRMAQYSVAFKASEHKMVPVECDPDQSATKILFLNSRAARPGAVQDSRFDCLGRLSIATVGLVSSTGAPLAAGTVVGQLYLSASMEFLKPCLPSVSGLFSPWTEVINFGGIDATTARLGSGSPNLNFDSYPTLTRPTATVSGNTMLITWPANRPSTERYEVLLNVTLTTGQVNGAATLSVTMTNGTHSGPSSGVIAPTTTISSGVITGATGIHCVGYETVPSGSGAMTMLLDMTGTGYATSPAPIGTVYVRITRLV
jgi:hypothetical protein